MTNFQLLSLGLFVAMAAVAYRGDLLKLVKRLKTPASAATVSTSIAVTIVNDLIAITELRDKLAAEDCPEGVDACTNLLRVIVEQTKPSKKSV